MAAIGVIPSLTQVRAWDVGHLSEAAARWTDTAAGWEDAFTRVSSQISVPGGTRWDGSASQAAQVRAFSDRLRVTGLADRLHEAARIAERGADQIAYAKQRVVDSVHRASEAGFVVGEDFSVTTRNAVSPADMAIWQAEAEAFATDIGARVGELVLADRQIAARIRNATAGVGAANFLDGEGESVVEPASALRFKDSPADDTSDPPAPGGGYGSYHYGYPFSTPEGWTKEQIMSETRAHFNNYFTFTADPADLVEGATINLQGPFGENEPVKVVSVTPDSFTFVSLPGHNEGAGRTITFSIVQAPASPIPGRLAWELRVAASGPVSDLSLIPGTSWLNKAVWQVFADNLNARLPGRPPQPGVVVV
ncbi:hypothetical protein [Mycolicibacterium aichiense]|uniref:Uncharacterized protein n=1 Tax=Mycolicibacterium aichiense TaxID=1799 RepID=A0AAD1HHE2_9MYCO|nr:hypothetical protein [Mycolicibacterium aichiense]MCV7020919.1 hypothetical protein [Mycolicibacterium aichiense]BBX05487.1 hypothetical protein MAIC_02900 [Mycolicibacterium aichiense]STZ25161.1 putative conserved membrane protein [Mycolicibacterium aichiense]